MKYVLTLFLVLFTTAIASGQGKCELKFSGTWNTNQDGLQLRFGADEVTAWSADKQVARAAYEYDPVKSSFRFVPDANDKVFSKTPLKIKSFNETSVTLEAADKKTLRLDRVDPNHYFIVLAARNGDFYDQSGPALQMLIKVSGSETKIDALGTYSENGNAAFGPVPVKDYGEFTREARGDSETSLRLEINGPQYDRSLKILKTWERRVRENALLYPYGSPLNNILVVKAITETLNQCGDDTIKLYQLNYVHPADWISDQFSPQFVPFYYFKELRRLNESAHIPYDKP